MNEVTAIYIGHTRRAEVTYFANDIFRSQHIFYNQETTRSITANIYLDVKQQNKSVEFKPSKNVKFVKYEFNMFSHPKSSVLLEVGPFHRKSNNEIIAYLKSLISSDIEILLNSKSEDPLIRDWCSLFIRDFLWVGV